MVADKAQYVQSGAHFRLKIFVQTFSPCPLILGYGALRLDAQIAPTSKRLLAEAFMTPKEVPALTANRGW